MKLESMNWPEVRGLDRSSVVVVIPTGAIEQHGPHLPLNTDTKIVTAIAEAVEREAVDKVLLVPTLWLGTSLEHIDFDGTLAVDGTGYIGAVKSIIRSLIRYRFNNFLILNGHYGNEAFNLVALRELKAEYQDVVFCSMGWYENLGDEVANLLEGPLKGVGHADEVETSLMLYLAPDQVQMAQAVDDGFSPSPMIQGLILNYEEFTEHGVLGYPSFATSEKGKLIFEIAVRNVMQQLRILAEGFILTVPKW